MEITIEWDDNRLGIIALWKMEVESMKIESRKHQDKWVQFTVMANTSSTLLQ